MAKKRMRMDPLPHLHREQKLSGLESERFFLIYFHHHKCSSEDSNSRRKFESERGCVEEVSKMATKVSATRSAFRPPILVHLRPARSERVSHCPATENYGVVAVGLHVTYLSHLSRVTMSRVLCQIVQEAVEEASSRLAVGVFGVVFMVINLRSLKKLRKILNQKMVWQLGLNW